MKRLQVINNKTRYKDMSVFTKVKMHIECAKSSIIKYFIFFLIPFAIFIYTLGYERSASYEVLKAVKITDKSIRTKTRESTGTRGGLPAGTLMTFTRYIISCKTVVDDESCYIDPYFRFQYNNYTVNQILTTKVKLHRKNNDEWLYTTAVASLVKVWIFFFLACFLFVWATAIDKTYDARIRKCTKHS